MRNSYFRIIVCVGALVLARTAGAQTCAIPPSGIISWWPFDETSGTTAADIVGNQTGTLVNSPIQTTGKVAGALQFNGTTSYVTAADSNLWALGARDFTIELWTNFNSLASGRIYTAIFVGNDEGPSTRNKWFFLLAYGNLQFHINGPSVGSQSFATAPFSPVIGQWYHLAVTRNGSTYTIYVNGTPMGSATNTAVIPDPNAPLTIGQAESLGFMPGLIDELTIYDRALSQAELQAIVDAGGAGKCKGYSYTYFPQVAIGGGYTGVFSLANTSTAAASGRLVLTDAQGNPMQVAGTQLASSGNMSSIASSFDFAIPAAGTITFMINALSGADPLTVGWARFETTANSVTASEVFEYAPGGNLQALAGVLPSTPVVDATIPVDDDDSQNKQIGYAIANPGVEDISVRLAIVDEDGTLVDDTMTIPLSPGQQIAQFLWQRNASYLTFRGSMVLRSDAGKPFVAVALQMKRGCFTVIPVIPEKSAQVPD